MAQVKNLQSTILNQQLALNTLPQAMLRRAFRGELMTCKCMNANEWDKFEKLRGQCSALKEILVPDNVWNKFQVMNSKERDKAFHRSMILLALERGYLNKITSPVHRYLMEGSRPKALVNNNYKNDLIELWMSKNNEKERHKDARIYMGKLVELQCHSLKLRKI